MIGFWRDDDGALNLGLPPITQNPWHPGYELSEDARPRVARTVASQLLEEAALLLPDERSIAIWVGGECLCGRVRP